MTATLTFDLDDPDDRLAHKLALHGRDYSVVLFNFDQWLRGKIKHENKRGYQPVRDELREIMETHGVAMEDML